MSNPVVDYKLLFDALPQPCLLVSPEFTVLHATNSCLQTIGINPEAVMGQQLQEVFPLQSDDGKNDSGYQLLNSLANNAVKENKSQHLPVHKYRIPVSNGNIEERYLEVHLNPVMNGEGNVYCFLLQFEDVTTAYLPTEAIPEEKLFESENRFRALIENSNDIVTLMDHSFKLVYRSPAAARVLGWTNEDMLGVEATKNIHPDDKPQAAQMVKTIMANPGKIFNDRFRMMHKNGHYLWIEGTFTNLLNDPFIKAIVFNFRDVTERKEIENRLIEREEQLELFIEYNPAAMAMFDHEMKYIAASQKWKTIRGIEQIDLIGKSHYELFPAIEQRWKDIHARCLKGAVEKNECDLFVLPDGTLNWIRWEIRPWHNASGEVGGIIMFAENITEKITSEKQKEFDSNNLNALINNTQDFMWSVDKEFRLITSNKAFDEHVLKKTGAFPIQGTQLSLIGFTTEQHKRFQQYFKQAFAGKTFTVIESLGKTEDQVSEISFYPIFEENNVVGTACFSRDITEKTKAEEKVREANERFELVVAATNDVIWDWDIKANTIWRNKNYYGIFGYSQNSNITEPADGYARIHPEDRKKVIEGMNHCFKHNKHFWTDEYRYLKADGSIAYILDCGYILYNEKGNAYRMTGAMLDITPRKIAEQELEKSLWEKHALAQRMAVILNNLPANIALLDDKGTILDINDAWREAVKQNSCLAACCGIGENYLDIAQNATAENKLKLANITKGVKQVLDHNTDKFQVEYDCQDRKVKRWYKMIVTALQEQEYTGALVMHIDISELRRLEEERLNAKLDEQKKITKAMIMGQEKEKSFIGKELHDNINQILASTKLYLDMAGQKNKTIQEIVKYPIELLNSSIQEIRQLSHRMVIPTKTIDLQELTNDLLNTLNQHGHIQTGFEYDTAAENLSYELKINIYRIEQELVNNILKYAEAENVSISIKANENNISLMIADDGKGFDLNAKGKGIGISNINSRVESFGGEMKIETAAGMGCRVEIHLPFF